MDLLELEQTNWRRQRRDALVNHAAAGNVKELRRAMGSAVDGRDAGAEALQAALTRCQLEAAELLLRHPSLQAGREGRNLLEAALWRSDMPVSVLRKIVERAEGVLEDRKDGGYVHFLVGVCVSSGRDFRFDFLSLAVNMGGGSALFFREKGQLPSERDALFKRVDAWGKPVGVDGLCFEQGRVVRAWSENLVCALPVEDLVKLVVDYLKG